MKNLIKYTIGLIILIPLSIAFILLGVGFFVCELLGSFLGFVLYGEGIILSATLDIFEEIVKFWKPIK